MTFGSSILLCDRSTQLRCSHSARCSKSSTSLILLWEIYREFNLGIQAENNVKRVMHYTCLQLCNLNVYFFTVRNAHLLKTRGFQLVPRVSITCLTMTTLPWSSLGMLFVREKCLTMSTCKMLNTFFILININHDNHW